MKYKHVQEIEAVQFTGDNRADIARFCDSKFDVSLLQKWEWLVRTVYGVYQIVTNYRFQKVYLRQQTIPEAMRSAFTRYANERTWPEWWEYNNAIERLKLSVETGIVPLASDVAIAALAVNQFANLQDRIAGQRRELARLNKRVGVKEATDE